VDVADLGGGLNKSLRFDLSQACLKRGSPGGDILDGSSQVKVGGADVGVR
jgi:hypothetical protein